MITRRAALLGIGAALAAPAIVKAESLMKIARLRRPPLTAERMLDEMLPLLISNHRDDAAVSDLICYGFSFRDEHGRRVDPREVFIDFDHSTAVTGVYGPHVEFIPNAKGAGRRVVRIERA